MTIEAFTRKMLYTTYHEQQINSPTATKIFGQNRNFVIRYSLADIVNPDQSKFKVAVCKYKKSAHLIEI